MCIYIYIYVCIYYIYIYIHICNIYIHCRTESFFGHTCTFTGSRTLTKVLEADRQTKKSYGSI